MSSLEGLRQLRSFEVHGERRYMSRSTALYFSRSGGAHSDHVQVVNAIVMQVRSVGETQPAAEVFEPSLELPDEFAATLMAELWRLGIRPPGVTDDSERVRAMQGTINAMGAHHATLKQLLMNAQAQLKAKDKTIDGLQRLLADSLGHNDV